MQYLDYLTQMTSQYSGDFQDEIRLCPELFQLLNDLTLSNEIPSKYHCQLYAAMGYFIAPTDIFPEETFGPIGFADDILFALTVLNRVADDVGIEPLCDAWPKEPSSLINLLHKSTAEIQRTWPSFQRTINTILNLRLPL